MRPKHRELPPLQRHRANVRSHANVYQRRGWLIPRPCMLCRSPKAQKHHPDYKHKLDVMWLCSPCHKVWHMWLDRNGGRISPTH